MAYDAVSGVAKKSGYAIIFLLVALASWWITQPPAEVRDPLEIVGGSTAPVEISNDKDVEIRIGVVNHSSSPTLLTSAIPSCGCLGVFDETGEQIAWPLTLQPHQNKNFLMKVSAESRIGKFSVSVNFQAEHRGEPHDRIAQLFFDAVPRVVIVPNKAILSSDELKRGGSRYFHVGGGLQKLPVVEKVSVSHPEHIVAEILTTLAPLDPDLAIPHRLWSPSTSIRVEIAPSLANVSERAAVHVSIAGSEKPLEIPIFFQPEPPIGIHPREVFLAQNNEVQTRTFIIAGMKNGSATTLSAPPEGVEIAAERVAGGKRIVQLRFRTADMEPCNKILFVSPGQDKEAFSVVVRVNR